MAQHSVSDADVNTLQEFLGLPKAQAVILLEKYVTTERAMNQYLEDPVSAVKPQAPSNQWEPADNLPAFRIDADDALELPSMTRPPSRVDNRTAEMGNNRLPAEGIAQSDDMQDADLQRALAMSRQDISGQETGVVGSGQQFGPATRPYYDSNQWAVTTIASSREIVDHPPPSKRQRIVGQPAFLRGSTETEYLAPLLNIYHSIPLAREAFSLPHMKVLSYGHDPQWWSGTSDENTKSISVEASGSGSQDRHNFLAELQCLMAFLDGTERAYGSVDALADLRVMKTFHAESPLALLLQAWGEASMIQIPDNQLTQIFTSTAMKGQGTIEPMKKDLVCLEPSVRRYEGQTLIDLLDSTVWDDFNDKIDDIWIQQCADIFTMRLYDQNREDSGLGIEIPAVWYPDRYMYEYREIAREWRRESLEIRQEINQCSMMQRRCEVAQGPGKRVIKIRDVLEAASKLAVEVVHVEEGSDSQTEDSSLPDMDQASYEARRVQSELQAILKKIDEKVGVLEQRKQELYQRIRSIGSLLTGPTDDPNLSPCRKYYLQGVSTKPNVTYVRRLNERDVVSDENSEASGAAGYQWWRTVWGNNDHTFTSAAQPIKRAQLDTARNGDEGPNVANRSHPYSVQAVDEEDVLKAAKIENNSVVLVYASENAMGFKPTPAQPAIRKFVEQDNRAFREEVYQAQGSGYRRSSDDTNTTIMEDILFRDDDVSPRETRELTPMSLAGPQRDGDGQPSPKRAKGEDAPYTYIEDNMRDEPPPYDDENDDDDDEDEDEDEDSPKPQMQERKGNKIGLLADQMLEKYGRNVTNSHDSDGPVHIEHARDPLR